MSFNLFLFNLYHDSTPKISIDTYGETEEYTLRSYTYYSLILSKLIIFCTSIIWCECAFEKIALEYFILLNNNYMYNNTSRHA